MKNIDITKQLSLNDFVELFEQLPLNDLERVDVKNKYWALYTVLVGNPDVDPIQAWTATKNTFVAQEGQIKDRMDSK